MQPAEQAQSGTSLELPATPPPETTASPTESTDLELPTPATPPLPSDTAALAAPGPSESSGPLGNLVIAHFRRVEIAMLGRILISTLGGALPASMVRVEHRRSLGRRLVGRAGEPIGITITAGDRILSFRAPELGVAEASAGHTVRGVVLSSTPMPVEQWLAELGDVLDRLARSDQATRAALERALLS